MSCFVTSELNDCVNVKILHISHVAHLLVCEIILPDDSIINVFALSPSSVLVQHDDLIDMYHFISVSIVYG